MAEKIYSWLQLRASFTHSTEIQFIKRQKNGLELCWLWIELLCLAIDHCKEDDIGFLRFNEKVPYTSGLLSDVLGFDKGIVEHGIALFERAGLLEIKESGDIWIDAKYIGKMLGTKTDAANRMERMRNKRKESVTLLQDVTDGYKTLPYIDIDKDKEREIEIEKECEKKHFNEKPSSFPLQEKVPYQQIIDAYHKHCGKYLPEVKFINNSRKSKMRARWKNELPNMQAWDDYFKKAAFCDFLMGKKAGKNGEPFRCAFDWLICPNNVVKVLEGKYV